MILWDFFTQKNFFVQEINMEETLYHTLMRFYVESRSFFTFLPFYFFTFK